MEQQNPLKCDFREMVDYLTDPDNVWNPEKYIPTRTLNGRSFGQESQIRFQYVRGSAYAEGYVGNWKFELFFSNLQGWQLHWTGTMDEGKFDDPQVQAFAPDAIISLMFIIGERVAPRRSPTPPITLEYKG